MGADFRRRKPQPRRLALPRPAKLPAVDVALGRPRHQRGAVGELRVVRGRAQAPRLHRRLDLCPAGRKGVDHIARDARDLEPPVRVRLLDVVPQPLQPLRQLRPVDRPDRLLLPEQPVIDHRAPLPGVVLDHVGNDAVSMELGIEVP